MERQRLGERRGRDGDHQLGGQAAFIRNDGILFTGTAQVSGGNLVVAVDGYPDFSSTFTDGSDYGIGTLNGTVTTGATLSASWTFTTNNNSSIPGNWSLSYQTLADSGSSSVMISGNYTDAVTSATVAISTTGVMTGQTASNSCLLNGSVATADSTHDVYEVSYAYSSCTGTYQVLNGVTVHRACVSEFEPRAGAGDYGGRRSLSTSNYGLVATLNGS